jgi:S-DNA-T family DNA segregation ATPase FtsK/SpoIIIE
MVAGSTGSGKSVFLHSLIESLTSGPRRRFTRLILVDPKRVEFGRFSSCPGLAYPVVEEADDLAALLSQLTDIMEERYRYLSKKKVRDLGELHRKEDEPGMPYLAVVIDEVADIFLSERGKEIKTSIIRLAQKSRAVGIHLVLATQRPSADIVDGLIKANFPTRIAFRTSSQVDSRVVLDRGGAETLFGKGDGLFVSPEREHPVRFQGAFSG